MKYPYPNLLFAYQNAPQKMMHVLLNLFFQRLSVAQARETASKVRAQVLPEQSVHWSAIANH